MPTIPYETVREQLMAKPGVKEAYDALEEEFAMLARAIDARVAAGKTQAQVAAVQQRFAALHQSLLRDTSTLAAQAIETLIYA